MTDSDLDLRIARLQDLPPTLPLSKVVNWVRQGRSRPVFHASAWLSRVR